jgi:xanthine dehydrogenase large subunit
MNPPHESAIFHVTGEALFVDDLPTPERMLHGLVVTSPHAHARILSSRLEAAHLVPGVAVVLSYKDIPGHNQMGPVIKDELCLAENETTFAGQAVFLIAAENIGQCRQAAARIQVEYEPLPAILTIEQAIEANSLLGAPRTMQRGNVIRGLQNSAHQVHGTLQTGAQEHWYLETQACLCIPGEGPEIMVHSSTQHPSETQALVAEVLGISRNEVNVEVKRIGGGFGGKETQANHTACWAALLCRATGRPVKIRLPREEDMRMTGKRHRFLIRYTAGFDSLGLLQAVRLELHSDGGAASDLSFAILERAMLHADNAYFIPNIEIQASVWKTHLPSNTAMRGFGGPQAMAAMETILDRVARYLKRDPLEIRRMNFYRGDPCDTTHYGQKLENNPLAEMAERLVVRSDYAARRKAISEFNSRNEFQKKGLALTPVKFGISFTTSFLNQAGALVLIYTDGTVLVSHGGTEMGQGLYTKIKAIAARELGIPTEQVKVRATSTACVPNPSPTAASSGSDLNGMAVKNAIDILKQRISMEMASVFASRYGGEACAAEDILFQNGLLADRQHPERSMPFAEAMREMNLRQVSLSASGFYRTPDIGWDRVKGWGRPFHYFVFSMAVTEVLVDILTGQHRLLRTDILHECARSLHPMIDRGQIEGGYVQGVGWCTTEEIKWDEQGRLMTYSPDTYKIPTSGDVPADFRVELLEGRAAPGTIHGSKAVGEPPFMLGLSAWLAIKDAVSAVADHQKEPDFSLPATGEVILLSAQKLRSSP